MFINKVIDKVVEVEVSKRVDTITKAISKLDTLEKEFKKINRNDSVSYINGEKVESMTDKRFQEIQKAKQVIDNLKIIYHLVKERGFTLDGAKNKLKNNRKETIENVELITSLEKIKKFLLELKEEL